MTMRRKQVMTDENSSVLKELILGTLLFGIAVALLGVWWVEDKKK